MLAVESFCALTHLTLSKSALQRLVNETGQALVAQQAEEAAAVVRVPRKEEAVV
jgi:hypothetical protein